MGWRLRSRKPFDAMKRVSSSIWQQPLYDSKLGDLDLHKFEM